MSTDGLDRRAFLQGGAAALGGAALALGGRAAWEAATVSGDVAPPADAVGRAVVPAHGDRQAGVGTAPQSFASFVSLDLVDGVDRHALVRLMRIWTDDVDRLTSGRPGLADTEPELAVAPARLTVTVGYGPGLFTAAGLEDQRPSWLSPLPSFSIDRLEDAWSGGDLLLQVCADDEVTIAHSVRLLVKDARTFTTVRWVQRGFRRSPGSTTPGTTMRNLMGQVDGTRNPAPETEGGLIWHTSGPSWLVGGTSMVIRRIAMDLDTWDAVDRTGREFALGRRLADGSPLTGSSEHDVPDLDAVDALGFPVIDTAAHIRRARSANPSERFLRRPYSYDDPPAAGAISRSGLVFVTFQRDPVTQFVPIQRQIDEADMLNRWTTPIGSAVFAIPGGFRPGEHLGERLLGT
ncbi:MAG TPA: Dyp-type peroxidase [Cellulomonadaceae bacterium]|nr:Dyp-type peroxidase [Cellulomonadaceae bacterium]